MGLQRLAGNSHSCNCTFAYSIYHICRYYTNSPGRFRDIWISKQFFLSLHAIFLCQFCIAHISLLSLETMWESELQFQFYEGSKIQERHLVLFLFIYIYSGPCDLRPLYLTIPCILRPNISDTTFIFPVYISLYFKTTFNLRPYCAGWMGGGGDVWNHRDHCKCFWELQYRTLASHTCWPQKQIFEQVGGQKFISCFSKSTI